MTTDISSAAARASSFPHYPAFDAIADGVVVHDAETGAVIDVNEAMCHMHGYSREEFIGMQVEDFSSGQPPFVQEEAERRIQKVAEHGPQVFPWLNRRKDGELFWVEVSLRFAELGDEQRVVATVRDITEQKKREQALRESEEKFRALAEKSQVGVCLFQDGLFEYVNPRFAEIFGYDREELIGKRGPKDMIHPSDWPTVEENIRRRLAGDVETANYQSRGVTKGGDVRYLELYGARIDYEGRPAIMGTVLDVTEKRRLQREILQVQEAERREMGQKLHDWIGSQLTGVMMLLRGLISDAEDGGAVSAGQLREVAALIRESTSDARRLAQGLDPVKLEQEGLRVALKHLAEMTDRRDGADCEYRERGSPPSLSEAVTSHLYWIAQEAVTNAVKYADAARITIRLEAGEETLDLIVEDDGRGLPDNLDQDGLGLRSMRYRAELIGGRLNVGDRPGGGTRIHCQITL